MIIKNMLSALLNKKCPSFHEHLCKLLHHYQTYGHEITPFIFFEHSLTEENVQT